MSTQLATIVQEGRPFLVGDWLVEPSTNRVSSAGVSTQLELKAIDVLLCLVEHAGEVVSKDALFDTVWQTEFVSDNTLANRIAQLRSAFGDDVKDPHYIETIRKRGYRLIAEVRPVTPTAEASTSVPEAPPPSDAESNPYPGLAAFTETDADRFFGREAEAAALWRKISARRLLAVIGPSGVGKSSLLRAGVAPQAPPGWRVVVFTPGEAPMLALARALAPDHTGDPAAMARLLGFSDSDTALAVVSRWRGQFEDAVLVVDQFEELFTLNPPEVQAGFIELLRRLVDAADVHVVLAMRDDYLYRCQKFPQIAPIFRELTPLPPPMPEGLRRALKEPAARRLYRFESELLVDRVITEVEGERGALPLMAFAVHRLWDERDRDERLLTEDAYERIGGVAGALAKHADATLERIGAERAPIVRELFRNLVTAEGTRAVREVDELLSVFAEGQRESAEEVLRELIDARLLTGYREQGDDEQPTRRVEIVHESLLTSWPRLVRWQTQDADSARLRDELRQAARLWADHERANDYLWTGKAFRELSVWRENYPGGLSDLEEAFASATVSHALRRKRWRRFAFSAALVALLAVLGVVAVSRQQAVAEARRAEAAKLFALGQLRLEDDPTATLAHAIASLELADTAEARRIALAALWQGPTAFVVNDDTAAQVEFAGSGEWLVQTSQHFTGRHFRVISSDGSITLLERVHTWPLVHSHMNPDGDVLCSAPTVEEGERHNAVLWSLPDGRVMNESWFEPPVYLWSWVRGWNPDRLLLLVGERDEPQIYAVNFDGTTERLGEVDVGVRYRSWYSRSAMDLNTGRWFATVDGDRVVVIEIGDHGLSKPRLLGRHEGEDHRLAFDPDGRLVATSNGDGLIKIWRPDGTSPVMTLEGPRSIEHLEVSSEPPRLEAYVVGDGSLTTWVWSLDWGSARLVRRFACGPPHGVWSDFLTMGWDRSRQLFAKGGPGKTTSLWSLSAPSGAEPLVLNRGNVNNTFGPSFHPSGRWLATPQVPGLSLWPLARDYAKVIRAHTNTVTSVVFGPDGEWLASGSEEGAVRLTQLGGEELETSSFVYDGGGHLVNLAASPDGELLLLGRQYGGAVLVRLDGGPAAEVGSVIHAWGVAFSPEGRLIAVTGVDEDNSVNLHVFERDTLEEIATVDASKTATFRDGFLRDGRVLSAGVAGLFALDPATGASDVLFDGICTMFSASGDGRRIVVVARATEEYGSPSRAVLLDLDAGNQSLLASHGDGVYAAAIDETGTFIVTGDREGVVRVGSTDGSEPHMLLGHEGTVWDVDIDPLGRWVASGSEDTTVRIWPMPDLSKPPLHTLPHDELLAKLKTLTNLRVVRDEADPTGWTLTHEPFPGWETVPTW